ncbi:MAG: hypothetical protein WEE53_13940 [Acidimicrobiia bacterium]
MTRHRVAALLVVIAGLSLSAALIVRGGREDVLLVVAALAFVVVGTLILSRTGNRTGWVVSAIGLAIFLAGVAGILVDSGMVVGEALGGALWFSWFFLAGLLFFLFPTGKPLSPRWRWLGWVGYLAVGVVLSYLVAEELCVRISSQGSCLEWVDNPIGIPGVPNPEYGNPVGELILVGFVLIAAVSLVIRYLRSHGTERLQLKWFAFAVVGMITVIFAQELLTDVVPEVVSNLVGSLTILALPAAIGVSVLRYHLYEIDRIVSRTVSYTAVVLLLAAVFIGVVTLLTSLLPTQDDLAVAGSTLAVAALFNPLRRRVQTWVDRRFNRSRYDAQKVMDDFAGSLRDRVDPDGVVEGWVGAVSETMQPSSVGVWVREAR